MTDVDTQPVRPCRQSGFTLFEVMIVLVIIGLMAALIVPNIMGRPEQARVSIAKADLRAIANALDLYKLDKFHYPTTQEGLAALVKKSGSDKGSAHEKEGSYLKKLPVDPWGTPYQYANPGTHGTEFDLYSYGPTGKDAKAENNKSIIGEWDL